MESRELQGSTKLETMLFNLSSYLEFRVRSAVARFANETRLFRMVKIKVDCKELQDNFSNLDENMSNQVQCLQVQVDAP